MTGAGEGGPEWEVDIGRLEYARIDGPGPVLAYMAETKSHVSLPFASTHTSSNAHLRKSRKKLFFVH